MAVAAELTLVCSPRRSAQAGVTSKTVDRLAKAMNLVMKAP